MAHPHNNAHHTHQGHHRRPAPVARKAPATPAPFASDEPDIAPALPERDAPVQFPVDPDEVPFSARRAPDPLPEAPAARVPDTDPVPSEAWLPRLSDLLPPVSPSDSPRAVWRRAIVSWAAPILPDPGLAPVAPSDKEARVLQALLGWEHPTKRLSLAALAAAWNAPIGATHALSEIAHGAGGPDVDADRLTALTWIGRCWAAAWSAAPGTANPLDTLLEGVIASLRRQTPLPATATGPLADLVRLVDQEHPAPSLSLRHRRGADAAAARAALVDGMTDPRFAPQAMAGPFEAPVVDHLAAWWAQGEIGALPGASPEETDRLAVWIAAGLHTGLDDVAVVWTPLLEAAERARPSRARAARPKGF